MAEAQFPPGAFTRHDESDDRLFYAPARFVTHIDNQAIAALTAHYAAEIDEGSVVLDLMSSWVSHLPADLPLGEVIGQGMNAAELAANPRLTQHFVADLNRDPALPLESDSVDVALCCVSVQYLTRPVELFADVARTVRPGGRFIVSYSNRCFPTKAVAIWQAGDLRGHAGLIHRYMELAGFTDITVQVLANGMHGDPLVAVTGTSPLSG